MNWKDFYFIVEVPMVNAGNRRFIGAMEIRYMIVDKYSGHTMRDVLFRREIHALRSVKRLMKMQELRAEDILLAERGIIKD